MITPATAIGAATLLLAALLIWLNVKTWWTTQGRPIAIFWPGLQGAIAGSSMALCGGGIIGTLAAMGIGVVNRVAGIIPWATGTQDESLASGSISGLNIWGGGVAFAITVTFVLAVRALASSSSASDKVRRNRLVGGAIVGACITYTAGIASLVTNYQIPFYNALGEQLPSALSSLASLAG